MDLDHFKDINDTLGHDTGDEVLKQTATRITSQLRSSDTAARTGGDEFTIFLENLDEISHAEVVAHKIVKILQQPFTAKDQEIYATVSLGISIYPDDGTSHDRLMQCADMAMYQAKKDGRNTFRYFSNEMRRISEEHMQISNQLRYALAKDEFSLVFQPKIDVRKGSIIGAEALLRWNNHELGSISPYTFIPIAESLGIINEIGTWVLEHACLEAKQWQNFSDEKLKVSVNVSPQQFRNGSLIDDVEDAVKKSGLPFDQLELEITESLLMQDSDKPLAILKTLHERGVSLALDDFGTGYSSLSYLRRFPLQVLKIDRSFIQDLEIDQNHKALVDAIIAMAQSLKLDIVAEGVENENQLNYLRKRDVSIIQGYLFSPPVPVEKFRMLLKN
jgi:diguanylate cyclase (GGDEF)-like protein